MPDETVIDGEVVALDSSGWLCALLSAGSCYREGALQARRADPRIAGVQRGPPRAEPVGQNARAGELVAKHRDSPYEPGQRSGAWQKMRVNQGQEFVGGYTSSAHNFDAIIFGYYEGGKLLYAGRTRNGFTPSSRK